MNESLAFPSPSHVKFNMVYTLDEEEEFGWAIQNIRILFACGHGVDTVIYII